MRYKLAWVIGVALSAPAQAQQDTLPVIEVEADAQVDATTATSSGDALDGPTPADGGEWLLQLPGISGVRMGSHGIDPVIRGQKANQLNILLDGAYVHGGCPNRMDPPTAYASTAIYDQVTVFKGVHTLAYGGGGSGGTVLFERHAPRFAPGESVQGEYGGGYRSNGDAWDAFADVSAGSDARYVRGTLTAKEADAYEDGDGNEVRSGYQEQAGIVTLGARTDGGSHYRLDLEAVRGEDILFAGAGMDAPVSDNDTYKFSIETPALAGFDMIKAEAYRSDVHHVMDNYTYRTNSMWMRVPSDSVTDGARLVGDMMFGASMLTLGIDMQNSDRDAIRFAGPAGTVPTSSQSLLWPGVEIEQLGLFVEYAGQVSAGNRYTAGLRYDAVTANAARADQSPDSGLSPNQLYSLYYGTSAREHTEDNIGALYRMEHDLDARSRIFWGISRTLRTADATERYLAANNMNTARRWVGNPDLDPEAHHQLDVGWARRWERSDLSVSVYYDRVGDFILRDRAHAQDGILLNDDASIYRNVDAELYGLDLEAAHRWSRAWRSRFTAAYVHATNTTDDRPIAQIPPLEGTASLEYTQPRWMLGGALRMVARQTRVDDNPDTGSGLDFGPTPGFAILDLYGSYRLGEQSEVRYGIDNVLDKTYAEHLNKPNAFDPSPVRVNEPGRSLWARIAVKF